jgi:hypothetical protein
VFVNASLPKARPVLLALTTVLVLLISLFSAPSAARADTLSIPGTLSSSSPTFTHLNPPGCTTGSVATHYRVIKARTTGTSPTQFTAKVTPNGFTANLTVYQGVFLPDMPIVNCFSSFTGSGPGVPVEYSFPIPAILPGFTYQDFFIVVAGNSASDLGSFTVEVTSSNHTLDLELEPEPSTDTTPPVVTVPGNMTREATGPGGAPVTYSGATAADDVDGSLTPLCSPASGATFPLGATTVTCSATDSAGNTGSNSFTVTVQDTTAPALSLPSSITEEATGSGGATVNFSASATDAVSGSVAPDCAPASGSLFGFGSTTVTCTATDAAGNTSTPGTFTVTVQDTAAPVLDLPADITEEATGSGGATVSFSASATDVVDGAITPVCTVGSDTVASGDTFPLGTTTVSCTATDSEGNIGTGSFDITVEDTTAPVLDLPADITEEATAANGAAVTYTATATDTVDGAITPVCTVGPDTVASGDTFPLGTTTVSCTATDAAGNIGTGSFDITVEDTTAPVLDLPADITEEATAANGAAVTYTATATDTVDGAITPVCTVGPDTVASGDTFPLGTTTVSCTATDAAGNIGTGSFDITVEDTTAPVLDLPSSVSQEASDADGAVVTYTATAEDLVDGALTPVCTPASGSLFPITTPLTVNTVTCTATDAAGNEATGTFNVTVGDTTAPVLAVPEDATREATGENGVMIIYVAIAEDAIDGPVAPDCTPASGSTFPLGDTTVTCTATDSAGNTSAPDSFVVSVVDTTAPVLDLPDTVIEKIIGAAPAAESSIGAVTAAFGAAAPAGAEVSFTASATDLVDGAITPVCTPASGTMFAVGDTTVTCTATDTAGNTATGSFTVSVIVVDPGTGPGTPGPGENGTSGPGKDSPSEPGLSRTGSAPHGLLAAGALLLALGALVVARSRRASQRAR